MTVRKQESKGPICCTGVMIGEQFTFMEEGKLSADQFRNTKPTA